MALKRTDFSYLCRDGRARHTLTRWAKDTAYTPEQLNCLRKVLQKDKEEMQSSRNEKLKIIARIDRLLFGVLIGRKLKSEELSLLLQHHKLAEEEMRQILLDFPCMFGSVKTRAGMHTRFGNYVL